MSDNDDRELKPLFLGPRAENGEMFLSIVEACLRDHISWRRAYQPGDRPWIAEEDQQSPWFKSKVQALENELDALFKRLRRSTPNYHQRYLGHMHTDLAMPGVLGEIAAMLYSQNNVVAEASPETSKLEAEAIAETATMVGYTATGKDRSYGHLTSGGTSANNEALWVARAVRHQPISLRIGINSFRGGSPPERQLANHLSTLTVPTSDGLRPIVELTTLELLNLRIPIVLGLRQRIVETVARTSKLTPHEVADKLLCGFGPEEIGPWAVDAELRGLGLRGLSHHPWEVWVAETRHYSFEKAMSLLQLGRSALKRVGVNENFQINVLELERGLAPTCGDVQPVPLVVVAVMGSTEEGAVDDLPALLAMRERLHASGVEFWLHADAAYGGYAAAVLRGAENEPTATLRELLDRVAHSSSWFDSDQVATWNRSLTALRGLSDADSITIDPHKMGFLAYSAGIILFKTHLVRHAVASAAPYLFEGDDVDVYAGRYTLEGSRPGSKAVALYLAQKMLPLHQRAHGAAVLRSFAAAGQLARELPRVVGAGGSGAALTLVNQPALNTLLYVLHHKEVTTLADQNRLTELVLNRLGAFQPGDRTTEPVFVVSTGLPLRSYRCVIEPLLKSIGVTPDAEEWDSGTLKVIRSVVMHPHAFGATTVSVDGTERPLAVEIAEALEQACVAAVQQLRQERHSDATAVAEVLHLNCKDTIEDPENSHDWRALMTGTDGD